MSVINQMLKDLDERQNEQNTLDDRSSSVVVKSSSSKLITITVVVVLLINGIGLLFWQLYNENKQLKAENSHVQASQPIAPMITPAQVDEKSLPESINKEKQESRLPESIKEKEVRLPIVENTPIKQEEKSSNNPVEKHQAAESTPTISTSPEDVPTIPTKVNQAVVKPNNSKTKPQMTISRKQLSADELARQKISRAERAVENNDLTKAEKLFEEVLLVVPENKVARKQLAALWFGKQSYQAAVNLLSQGIALSPNDSEYRLMKARIYLSQGQTLAAVTTLKVLAAVKNIEYQSLLASSAQQAEQFSIAAQAYQLLTTIQPEIGRWWLGLAVAFDSNSQFKQAIKAYQQARDSIELSESARQFTRQRLQELGD